MQSSWVGITRKFELSETQIETQVLHYLRYQLGVLSWKNPTGGYFDTRRKCFRKHASPFARNGAPDVILIVRGFFVGFEIKTRLGKQSDAQKAFEKDILEAGGYYFIIRSLEDAKNALSSVLLEILPSDEI